MTTATYKEYRALLVRDDGHRRLASAARYLTIEEARAAGEKSAAKLDGNHEVHVVKYGERVG